MPLKELTSDLVSAQNLKRAGMVFGGFVVSEQGTTRVVRMVDNNFDQFNILDTVPEVSGVLTAAGFYGVKSYTDYDDTPEMMAYGGLVQAADKFTDRPSVRNITGGEQ